MLAPETVCDLQVNVQMFFFLLQEVTNLFVMCEAGMLIFRIRNESIESHFINVGILYKY